MRAGVLPLSSVLSLGPIRTPDVVGRARGQLPHLRQAWRVHAARRPPVRWTGTSRPGAAWAIRRWAGPPRPFAARRRQRAQGLRILARLRRALLGRGMIRGVVDLVPRAMAHHTERACLCHARSLASHRGHVGHHSQPGKDVRGHRSLGPAVVDRPARGVTARAAPAASTGLSTGADSRKTPAVR
jgi:hypothetical protein